ncbi:UDP-N-acetylmuramoyl-L-alanyl-D-glutamate--2,6-diaminopimelate ligase [Faecalibacter bovis]|uniref:UDP-N-acetylmuramoyl-L-alanyl-D-glutamate--2,6-diaminopimelate ligase n=1 Tax=Faecalibacter bovis TaxID=2898187 RepID=A0ABX7XE94_9FLAO|nr:UDP-N-acetylmuramoyl-L-alanyl-D-glutamate--2,6-diaminopimelate ligase [Faecalibacter bovis]MBS7333659.1 UDP-N-acetylmuramoyl-L-alanyl-D-glutamate--2,6-diaminopimelate ligase [Weeksellaceae bacterium]QTV06239.1 UDP-N-acetylmuramoyl-L-alanyl-D-glutamate--2,6-diaminopimelate ligase [Faecalibacter bovis]
MRSLKDLLYGVSISQTVGRTDVSVNEIQFDSRKVKDNDVFVAVRGVTVDGHAYINKAIELGALAVICEEIPTQYDENVTYIQVTDAQIALGVLASNYYDNPTKDLKLVGITGTNGKTTTTTLLYELFTKMGYACALISTIKIVIDGEVIPSTHTTPDILTLNKMFREAVDRGCEFAFMEVSSHGIHQNRIAGLHFSVAGFNNITHDHLDYHVTFANYIAAKKKFFDDLPKSAVAITNIDDKNGLVMLQNTVASKKTYALRTDADFKAKILENQFDGMLLEFNGKEFWTSLIGRFNAYNLLEVFAIASILGQDELQVLTTLSTLKNVDGRFETFKTASGIVIIVDYAHTPDALENVLNTIDAIRTKNEKLITVVGCGGDRDKTKRPEMADIASSQSQVAIFTSDNPRTEDPEVILQEMEAGVKPQFYNRTLKITDRKEAIKTALKMAEPNDIVLIAGKGHETYQEINGVKSHFSDLEVATELSQLLNK